MNNLDFWSADRFYSRLDFLLEERHWSLHRLSIKTDTSVASLYEMRRKKFLPRFKTLCMICDALEISLCEFFYVNEHLSNDAYYLLSAIETLPEEGQKIIVALVKLLAKNS